MWRFAKQAAILPLQSYEQLANGSEGSQVGRVDLSWALLLPTLLPKVFPSSPPAAASSQAGQWKMRALGNQKEALLGFFEAAVESPSELQEG